MILSRKFFEHSAVAVAKDLLGKYLVCRIGKRTIALMITETEAYHGPEDLASHAARGRKTKRNLVMFGQAGLWYVYFTYGMHWMLNIVTGKKGYPSAVLIRSVIASDTSRAKRRVAGGNLKLDGPAKLTKALHIDKSFNAKLADCQNGLWIEDNGARFKKSQIHRGPRVGVAYAGPVWSKKPYRFWIKI